MYLLTPKDMGLQILLADHQGPLDLDLRNRLKRETFIRSSNNRTQLCNCNTKLDIDIEKSCICRPSKLESSSTLRRIYKICQSTTGQAQTKDHVTPHTYATTL
jgi:hypothetical protein